MARTSGISLQDERYLLLETIGRGGMGRVYRAFDRMEQRLVALKVPGEAECSGPSHPLSAEFEVWSWLDHPNIVRAFELGTARSGPIPRGTPYLVLEYVNGGPVHRMFEPRNLTSEILERIAAGVLAALAHLHCRGIVHRDLKPGNILVDPAAPHGVSGHVKLTDFGLAVRSGRRETPGTFSGSIPYIAPESLLGKAVDLRADLYGLGMLLYRLSTGRFPSDVDSVEKALRWHLSDRTADPRVIRPDLSRRFSRFVRRLTARDRDLRPDSASAALELIDFRPRPTYHGQLGRIGRDLRTRLRLAFDAARLGAIRVFSTTCREPVMRALETQVSVWAQVRGLGFFALREGPLHGPNGLGTLVMQLLLSRAATAGDRVRRHRLQRALPLDLLGATPVLDASRFDARRPASRCIGVHARAIRDFILESTAMQPMVLWTESAARRDPLVRRVFRLLESAARRMRGFELKPGGLLAVLAETTVSTQSSRAFSPSDSIRALPPKGALPAPPSTGLSDRPEAPRSA